MSFHRRTMPHLTSVPLPPSCCLTHSSWAPSALETAASAPHRASHQRQSRHRGRSVRGDQLEHARRAGVIGWPS
jgi:hypothetical protein